MKKARKSIFTATTICAIRRRRVETGKHKRDAGKKGKKKKRKEKSQKRGRKPTGRLSQSAWAVQTCSMGKTNKKSEHRHGENEKKQIENTVGQSAGLLTGPENQVGSKACRSAGEEVERKKVMKGTTKGDENTSDNERKEEGEGE